MRIRNLLILLLLCCVNVCASQDWMTSMKVAQKLALRQNKMILMIWEEDTHYPFPMIFTNTNNDKIMIDLFQEEDVINNLLWKYFVPVKVSEIYYSELLEDFGGERSSKYMDKFNDDSLKVLDVHGNILNVNEIINPTEIPNINNFINKYALDTNFLYESLKNYGFKRNFTSTFNLAKRYIDYAVLVNPKVKNEVVALSSIYLNEAKSLLLKEEHTIDTKSDFAQRIELLKMKQYLILGKPRKVIRFLKKMEGIVSINESLFASLNYAAYLMKGDEKEALTWKTKVSLVDLKKANLIIKNHIK